MGLTTEIAKYIVNAKFEDLLELDVAVGGGVLFHALGDGGGGDEGAAEDVFGVAGDHHHVVVGGPFAGGWVEGEGFGEVGHAVFFDGGAEDVLGGVFGDADLWEDDDAFGVAGRFIRFEHFGLLGFAFGVGGCRQRVTIDPNRKRQGRR